MCIDQHANMYNVHKYSTKGVIHRSCVMPSVYHVGASRVIDNYVHEQYLYTIQYLQTQKNKLTW